MTDAELAATDCLRIKEISNEVPAGPRAADPDGASLETTQGIEQYRVKVYGLCAS